MSRLLGRVFLPTLVFYIPWFAAAAPSFDVAAAFGARPSVENACLSPDGTNIAYVSPTQGQGSVLYVLSLQKQDAQPRPAFVADGKPLRLQRCEWVSNTRIACTLYGVVYDGRDHNQLLPFTRLIAVDADGNNLQTLSNQDSVYSVETLQFNEDGIIDGGEIIDALPEQDGTVLMSRRYAPVVRNLFTGGGSSRKGWGVDRVDTRTLAVTSVELPLEDAAAYLSDGHGTVRIVERQGKEYKAHHSSYELSGILHFMYRTPGSRTWLKLSDYNTADGSGFRPLAVDSERNVVYGHLKVNGKIGLYSVALDGTLHQELVYERPAVDVSDVLRIGRRERPVGVRYDEDKPHFYYFDPGIRAVYEALTKTLPTLPDLTFVGSSLDENRLLVRASSDQSPGSYYLFDRKTRELTLLLAVRDPLADAPLAAVRPIHYRAADGTEIPAYLTLPAAAQGAKNLPAIVLPDTGAQGRDLLRFDWLAQFFAARGYVVLQPTYRAPGGYRSWPTSIGDVLDAAHWLVAQGIADPAKLAIVGEDWGGYVALQSSAVDPKVFKAVVAIMPVTDPKAFVEERRYTDNLDIIARYIGTGPQVGEGSPIQNAAKISAPVLLFHGEYDTLANVQESKDMAARLTRLGKRAELVTWPQLDQQLEDSQARAQMLRKSDEFLRASLGM
jgi:dipeptidyl aminopeptidase/acylaminoacyl peptidase